MTIDGTARSPLVTDYGRWRRVLIQSAAANDLPAHGRHLPYYGAKTDMTAKTIAMTSAPTGRSDFKFQRPEPAADSRRHARRPRDPHGHQVLRPKKFPLLTRGFNWIQERPFNR